MCKRIQTEIRPVLCECPATTLLTGLTLSTNASTVGIAITATVTLAGETASYQWYTNTTAATTGGAEINGADYAPRTSAAAYTTVPRN